MLLHRSASVIQSDGQQLGRVDRRHKASWRLRARQFACHIEAAHASFYVDCVWLCPTMYHPARPPSHVLAPRYFVWARCGRAPAPRYRLHEMNRWPICPGSAPRYQCRRDSRVESVPTAHGLLGVRATWRATAEVNALPWLGARLPSKRDDKFR